MDLDPPTRRMICELVAGIVTADAALAPSEAAFVYRLARGFNVEVSGPGAIQPIVDPEVAAERVRDLPRAVQDTVLEMLVEAAHVDGRIDARERAYLRSVGAALMIADEDIERRIVQRLTATR